MLFLASEITRDDIKSRIYTNRVVQVMLCILRVFYIGGICAAVRRIFPDEVFHGGNAVLHGMSPQVSGSVMFCSELVL